MKENEPEFSKENQDKRKEFAKKLRHNPAMHAITSIGFLALAVVSLAATQEGRDLLMNPEFRKTLIDKEKRTGLLEDSILAPSLWHPNADKLSIQKTESPAGRWVCYDFRRPAEFSTKKVTQLEKGRLVAFPLSEVVNNSPETYTPTSLFNFFNLTHILEIEFPTIQELLNYGLIKETNYETAYKEAGEFEKYEKIMTLKNILSEKIYQITPKGNGLVFLSDDGGENQKEEDRVKKLIPEFNGFPL